MNKLKTMTEPPISLFSSQDIYLGPAKVGKVAQRSVLLVFPDQEVWANLALSISYQPVNGDTVLAISQQDKWYVIGVLEGKGTTSITAPGNLELRAPHGDIRLVASKSVKIKTNQVDIVTEQLNVAATSVWEKFQHARRCITETYAITAGSLKAVVEATLRLKGKRIVQRAEEDVKIDGQKIRLG